MDSNCKMILLKGKPNDDIIDCQYDINTHKYVVIFKSGKRYSYSYQSIKWLENPKILSINEYRFKNKDGITFFDISNVLMFQGDNHKFFQIYFNNGTHRSYNNTDLIIEKNALADRNTRNILSYYKSVSELTGMESSDGTNLLKAQFDKMSFISEKSILATFLNGVQVEDKQLKQNENIIFPFGSNLSQIKAVTNAITSKISVIEGPPGTGKTQTILNIIANIVMRGQTVAVVSNNNSATDNVFEKLQKYGFEYISAQLGNKDNKNDFIKSKQLPYPNFSKDTLPDEDIDAITNEICTSKNEIIKMLEIQNKIAKLKHELSELETERKYFEEYFFSTYTKQYVFSTRRDLSSKKLLTLWNELEKFLYKDKKIGFWFKLKVLLFYGIKDYNLYKNDINYIIALLKKHFYETKQRETIKEIKLLKTTLEGFMFKEKLADLTDKSIVLFKAILSKKYNGRAGRKFFDDNSLWKCPIEFLLEYPVILSTTHSAISSLKGVTYDYVIVDEASQVDLVTGVLTMSCTKKIVIVGDLKQLPNVITEKDKKKIADLSNALNIKSEYRYEYNSLLSSICTVFTKVPRTLLCEHYRCHPKIINFCNQKFYNNQLVVMTEDKGEEDVLKVYVTAKGNHARDRFNQRQIDVIKYEVLPELASVDVGIISPYRSQTSALTKQLHDDIDISTVHKFQGREKDDIIISSVDNEITEFTDNSNMLNVAVSRAKNRLRLIVSDNEKNENTNVGDLVKYIKYNNFEVIKSDIFSVFDMLYKCYEAERKLYLKKYKRISEYDSENLMYSIIEETLMEDKFAKLDVIIHQPLNAIIRNLHKLSDEECKYVMNDFTHVDFLIYNKIDKSIVLAIEVDGYFFHELVNRQKERDKMKNTVLAKYNIPIFRFSTIESMEKSQLQTKLNEILY